MTGAVRVRAIARVWRDGQQENRSRTFTSKREAVAWAESVEAGMLLEKIRARYRAEAAKIEELTPQLSSRIALPPPHEQQNRQGSISDICVPAWQVIDAIERLLGDRRLAMLNTALYTTVSH